MQGLKVTKIEEFIYSGSSVLNKGNCSRRVKKRMWAGGTHGEKVSEVTSDNMITARMKELE